MSYWIGLKPFLLVQGPIMLLSASVGGWLFYVQHQFADSYWSRASGWNFREAALHGSSYYDLPPILRWFTANIGLHHAHHLCSRIPFYRLPLAVSSQSELRCEGRLTLWQSFRCAKLALWDERRSAWFHFVRPPRRFESRLKDPGGNGKHDRFPASKSRGWAGFFK